MPSYCYLDISVGDQALERIVLEMFDEKTPKTCENFKKLCTGNNGAKVEGTDIDMSFVGSTFHRIIKEFMIQGGDFTNHDGTGGVSIYGEQFEDENFELPCDRAGLLCMANRGPNTNGSQFFLTCAPAKHLTGRHVVFGKVVRGMNAVRFIEGTPTGKNDKPVTPVTVIAAGELSELPPVVPAADGDSLADYPQDCDPPLDDKQMLEGAEATRLLGNALFGKGELMGAVNKYSKALRYLAAITATSAVSATIDEKKVVCHSNSAMCYLKLQKWGEAKKAATEAVDVDGKNVKALFRRSVACIEMNDFEEAQKDLKKAQQLEPNNADVAAKLEEAKQRDKARTEKLAAGYRKMFG